MTDLARLLAKTLELVAPRESHSMVMGEALRNAGLLDVPGDNEEFRRFVEGPLTLAATNVIGADKARQLRTKLLAFTSLVGNDAGATLPLPRARGSQPGEKKSTLPALRGDGGDGPPPAPRSDPQRDHGRARPSDTLPYGEKKKY
jgi:hypothetical protein